MRNDFECILATVFTCHATRSRLRYHCLNTSGASCAQPGSRTRRYPRPREMRPTRRDQKREQCTMIQQRTAARSAWSLSVTGDDADDVLVDDAKDDDA
ncbi:hypothetical protein BCR44DRAFT_1426539 [Catenaria anguillulae PL171]|uniref:Uncharacterized protein n=1 Tax=Catenaria anguillulae PL171 TaxID=765915 RepID=A0A1Y2I0D0_9FUNG|nr:hypothetical protein BCR44DRAFT_1426539 [Catenaria anguillulae PL171]